MITAPFYCVGNSHTAALVHAAAKRPDLPLVVIHAHGSFEYADGRAVALLPEVAATIAASTGPVFSMIGGNAHNNFGIIRQGSPMDFIHPRRPDLPLNRRAARIPYQLMRDAVQRRAGAWPAVFNALCALAPSRVVHFESPPPVANADFMNKRLVKRFQARGLTDAEVAPAMFRYKLWQVNSDIYREACDAAGAVFMPSPVEAQTAGGFLARPYWADPTHANAAYGALILKQMEALADVASL